MKTVSLAGSVSRCAGGLFESVRRLDQELINPSGTLNGRNGEKIKPGVDDPIHVMAIGLRDEFTEIDIPAWHPVPVRALAIRGPKCLGYAAGLCRVLKAENPDLVHVHGLWQYSSLAALQWHRKSCKPYIVSPHGMLDPWALGNSAWKKRLAWFAYERSHLRRAGCIRALCQSEAAAIKACGLGNPICVIPNGIDLPDDKKGACEDAPGHGIEQCMPGTQNVLLYLGRIHPKKGLTMLLRAWAELQRPHDWVLVIAGWDQAGHEAELKCLAGDLGIDWAELRREPSARASLFFAGPQFGVAKRNWFRRCDAVILPSLSEGLPMVVLEAWAYSKPVLMTPQCNLPEGMTAGAAIPIEPSVEAIAAGLHKLFRTDEATRKSIGACGRELVKRKFAWPKIVADLKAVYRWLGGNSARPDCVLSC
jgi:poly(glycerol-phosphate) alpha-glucosyltransferase